MDKKVICELWFACIALNHARCPHSNVHAPMQSGVISWGEGKGGLTMVTCELDYCHAFSKKGCVCKEIEDEERQG